MTSIEVIKNMNFCGLCTTGNCAECDRKMAKDEAIKALEEIQQYREIGTPEEFRAAMILVKKNAAKKFPIMRSEMIPWEVLEPHEPQALRNHGQDLETLAYRGGLSWGEAAAILEGRRFEKKDEDERESRLRVLKAIDDFYGAIKQAVE